MLPILDIGTWTNHASTTPYQSLLPPSFNRSHWKFKDFATIYENCVFIDSPLLRVNSHSASHFFLLFAIELCFFPDINGFVIVSDDGGLFLEQKSSVFFLSVNNKNWWIILRGERRVQPSGRLKIVKVRNSQIMEVLPARHVTWTINRTRHVFSLLYDSRH